MDAASATKRLAFDEFLMIQLGMLQRKRAWQEIAAGHRNAPPAGDRWSGFYASLPFGLTGAQQRVTGEILADISSAPCR